jgi:hypothetical protein
MAEDNLEALLGRIPACCSTTPDLRCCCGKKDCAYLKHNCVALDDLEQEVRTAAQLGQVNIPVPPTFILPEIRSRSVKWIYSSPVFLLDFGCE